MSESIYLRHPRSFLLSDTPIGLGTAEAESITSYLQRIAPLNDLTFGELMWGKSMGEHEEKNSDMAIIRGVGSASLAQGSVCVSAAGLKFAEALGRLCGQPAVRWMNWCASTEGLSHARLMRKHQAWCPLCLGEDTVPYFRGLWDLGLATACGQHNCQLLHTCAQCGAHQRRYRCKGDTMLCQRCDHPLAANPTTRAQAHEVSIARELGALISEVTGQRLRLSGGQMKTAIFAWAESQGAKSGNAKAHLLRMPQSLVCYWSHLERVPSLQRLLEVSVLNGLPLLEVCRGSVSVARPRAAGNQVKRAWRFRLLSEQSKASLRIRLAEIASDPFPPCLQHVAKILGVARGTLEALNPQLCSRLSKRSNDHRNITTAARFIHFRTSVDRCIEETIQSGKTPTVKSVGDKLRNPGLLRSPKCREYVRAMVAKARRELSADIATK